MKLLLCADICNGHSPAHNIMAFESEKKNRLRLVVVVIILSLILLAPFVVYYHWRSPRLHSEGLNFSPNPMLKADCKDGSISQNCPSCPQNVTVLVPVPQGDYIAQTRCQLDQPFTVYVYKDTVIPILYTSDIADIEAVLKMTNSWTDTPTKACLFLCVIGPSQSVAYNEDVSNRLSSLPYWNSGLNHVLVDIPEVGSISPTVTNFSSALVAKGTLLNSYMLDFTHIITPPVAHSPAKFASPALYHTSQTHILYFEGESTKVSISPAWLESKSLPSLGFNVKFTCKHAGGVIHSGYDGEWGLCTVHNQRLQNCADSRFSLVLGAPRTSAITYIRLIEALQCGAVPVIVGMKRLPFDNVINWNKAGILLPVLISPHDLDTLLKGFLPETLMEYRRQGQFLHATYFSSRKAVLHTIVAILRSRLMHPPPAAQEFSGKVFKVNNNHSKILVSPRFLYNFTIYSEGLWNNAPGPFYMYPVTPYRSPYVPEMFNKPADDSPDNFKPPILKGDMFRSSLHGIHPSEGFTVVALTYHRSQHLAEFVKGFEGCTFLAKIVIVWNDQKEPVKGFKLPDIGVPIEVCFKDAYMYTILSGVSVHDFLCT